MQKKILLLTLFIWLLAGNFIALAAEDQGNSVAAQPSTSAAEEIIFYAIPEQWSRCSNMLDKKNKKQYSEYIPASQYKNGWENSWTDMISVIVWSKDTAPSALKYMRDNVKFQSVFCDVPLVTGNIQEYTQHGLKMYMLFMGCQKVKNNKYSAVSAAGNEITFMKIIEGKDNLLISWISKKDVAFVGTQPKIDGYLMQQWRMFLDAVVLLSKAKFEEITASKDMQNIIRVQDYVKAHNVNEAAEQAKR